jgi:hypothetical protein
MVRKGGLEPPWVSPPDPKSGASANSATFARRIAKLTTNATGTDYSSILGIHCPIVKLPADRPAESGRKPGKGGIPGTASGIRRVPVWENRSPAYENRGVFKGLQIIW